MQEIDRAKRMTGRIPKLLALGQLFWDSIFLTFPFWVIVSTLPGRNRSSYDAMTVVYFRSKQKNAIGNFMHGRKSVQQRQQKYDNAQQQLPRHELYSRSPAN
jgi:hypothetical protein